MDAEMAIQVVHDGQLATLTIDRPRVRNALNLAALEQLQAALDELTADLPRVLIVRAAAPGFCAGIDLKESREATSEFASQRSRTMHKALRTLRRFPAPVIMAIDGAATGLGCELAISGDLRLASPASRFSYLEPRVAVPSPSSHLLRLIGLSRTQDMLLTARWVDAAEAERIGLVTQVVADPDAAALELATRVAALAPFSLRSTKENIFTALDHGADAATEHAIAGVTFAAGTADRREALAAFAEKRDPHFTGE
jgi:enoyl-CoA hydratase/carnithine racemase